MNWHSWFPGFRLLHILPAFGVLELDSASEVLASFQLTGRVRGRTTSISTDQTIMTLTLVFADRGLWRLCHSQSSLFKSFGFRHYCGTRSLAATSARKSMRCRGAGATSFTASYMISSQTRVLMLATPSTHQDPKTHSLAHKGDLQ